VAADLDRTLTDWLSPLWGDVRASYLEATVRTHENLQRQTHQIRVSVFVKDHERLVHGYRLSYEAREVCVATEFSNREIYAARDNLPRIFEDSLKAMAVELAPLLYECDPRLGTFLNDPDDKLPAALFFDPRPLLPPLWITGGLYPTEGHRGCTLCGEPFAPQNRPMWGGGNVLWVHMDCWCQGLPKLGPDLRYSP